MDPSFCDAYNEKIKKPKLSRKGESASMSVPESEREREKVVETSQLNSRATGVCVCSR